MLQRPPLCPSCGAPTVDRATFGPGGTVWSSTVLRIRVADRKPPTVLAYVDFDNGPRALVHVDGPAGEPLRPGARVRLLGRDDRGDPLVTPTAPDRPDQRAREGAPGADSRRLAPAPKERAATAAPDRPDQRAREGAPGADSRRLAPAPKERAATAVPDRPAPDGRP